MSKHIKYIAYFLFISVLLLLSIQLAVENPYTQRFLTSEIKKAIKNLADREFQVNAIAINYLPPSINAYGITIKNSERPDQLITAQALEVGLDFKNILLGRKKILRIILKNLNANIIELPEGKTPTTETQQKNFHHNDTFSDTLFIWPPENDLIFSGINLVDSSVTYQWTSNGKYNSISLSKLSATLDISDISDWSIDLNAKHSNIMIENAEILNSANLDVSIHSDKELLFKTSKFHIDSKELSIINQLTIELITEKQKTDLKRLNTKKKVKEISINSNFNVTKGDLAALGRYLNTDQTDGPFQAVGQLDFAIGSNDTKFALDIKLKSQNARLSGFRLLDSQIDMAIDKDGINFYNVNIIEKDKLLANSNGQLRFSNNVDIDYDIQLLSINLSQLLNILNVGDFDTVTANLSSENLRLYGRGSPLHLKLDGLGTLREVEIPVLKRNKELHPNPITCNINFDTSITQQSVSFGTTKGFCEIEADISENQKNKIHLNGDIAISNEVDTDFSIKIDDARSGLTSAISNLPLTGNIETKLRFQSSEEISTINIASHSKNMKVGKNQFQNFALDLNIEPSRNLVHINNFSATKDKESFLRTSNLKITMSPVVTISGPISVKNIPKNLPTDLLNFYNIDLPFKADIDKLEGIISLDSRSIRNTEGSLQYELSNLEYNKTALASRIKGEFIASPEQTKQLFGKLFKSTIILNYSFAFKKNPSYQPPNKGSIIDILGMSNTDWYKIEIDNNVTESNFSSTTSDVFVEKQNNFIADLPFVDSYIRPEMLASNLRFDLKIEGKGSDIQGKIQGELFDTFIFESPVASTQFNGFINGSNISIPIIKHSGDALIARLNIDLKSEGFPFEGKMLMNQFDFRPLIGTFFANDPRNYAYLSADSNIKGKLNNWWNSNGNFNISKIAIGYHSDTGDQTKKISLVSDEFISLRLSENYWGFQDNKKLTINNRFASFQVDLEGNDPPENLSAKIKSTIDVSILDKFIRQVDFATGQIDFNFEAKGSIDKPILSMSMKDKPLNPFSDKSWQPVTIGLKNSPPSFSNVRIDASITNGVLKVKNLQADKGKQGGIKATGILDMNPNNSKNSILDIEIDQASFTGLDLPGLPNTNVILSGALNITGAAFPLNVSGDLTLNKAQSIGNYDLRSKIIESISSKANPIGTSADENNSKPLVNLDVSVLAEKTIFVKNRNLESTLSGDLKIEGNNIRPLIIGQISAEEGNFVYKQKFSIERAIISFEEPTSPPDPRLDIIGQTLIDNYQVRVQVDGTATNPQVNFEIDPPNRPDGTPISKVDIIVLISSGKLPAYDDQSPIKLASSEALNLFVGFAEGPLEKIFNASGQSYVRQVYLDTYLSENQSRPITRLNLPVDISNDLTLILQVDDDENFKLTSQYNIHDNISLSGSFDKKKESRNISEAQGTLPTDTTVDLRFKFSFD